MRKLLLLLVLLAITANAQLQRTEPPFWYANMHNPELQILFYGKNIAENSDSVSNKVVITNVQKTENPNYLFVTIDTKNLAPQDLVFSFSKNKKIAFTKTYPIKPRK